MFVHSILFTKQTKRVLIYCLSGLIYLSTAAQQNTTISVDASKPGKPLNYSWVFFGNDEANWAYTRNGQKLLSDLNKLSPVPVNMRAHHLFTSGDPVDTRLKWSPGGVYTEDEEGNAHYNWDNIDKLFDAYLANGIKPFVELGFMPQDLSVKREPYDYVFGEQHMSEYGHVYPPKDYDKWADLVREFIKHLRGRYGQKALESWFWEVWNEPDIFFWQGTTEEYLKLYDYSVAVVKDELPNALVGGPTTTSPTNERSAQFLRDFLSHVTTGTNYITGKKGSPLDFISIHSKGKVELVDGKVQMGIQRHLARLDWSFRVISEFPELSNLPILLGESDPEGTAAYDVEDRPENVFRQGPIYPTYNITVLNKIHELADQYGFTVIGNLTWAFHFEGSDYFEGYRELATNGINKAVLTGFRMLGMMRGRSLEVTSNRKIEPSTVVKNGLRNEAEISAVAARTENEITILVWNYHDFDESVNPEDVTLTIENLTASDKVLIEHFRLDEDHGNPYRVWLEMGAPKFMTNEQLQLLHDASELPLIHSPEYYHVIDSRVILKTQIPRFSLSLFKISW